jgi:PAS domain S-box-containing protein
MTAPGVPPADQPGDDFAGLDPDELRLRLREAQETLDAIRNGEVDAVVVGGASGQKVYTLESADRPYRVLIEQMQEGAVTLAHDGTLLYCNRRFADLLDVQRESLIGHAFTDHIVGEDVGQFRTLIKEHRGVGRSTELLLRARDAGRIPVNLSMIDLDVDDGMPRLICCVVTDLTRSRQRSHELAAANTRLATEIEERKRAEESLDLALDAAGMGSWDFDLQRDIVRGTGRYNEMFDGAREGQQGGLDRLLARFSADDRAAVADAFETARRHGSIEFEKRVRTDGEKSVRWVHMKGRTYYQDGEAVRIAGVVSDVTERRLVQQQLHQAQKMEAIGQLTGGIAHDFNNLLMVIGGSIDLLESRVGRDARAAPYLAAARQGVDRGATLNQQLLAFSRQQDLHVEAVCVDDLIAGFGTLVDRAVGETISVTFQPAAERWFCKTDPHQLETAILNLAINARDAMPSGGALTVSTELSAVDATTASIHGVGVGEYVCTVVSDTGVGMGAELVGRVFEPFFTTKEVGKGTGLGLSQVYGFARQSGGFVTLESEPGAGTSVRIFLPRTDQEGQPTMPEERSPRVQGSGTILVVEDDINVRAITCDLFSELGYTVLQAESAQDALALIAGGAEIDLVFSDVIMPGGMSGIDLMNELAQRTPKLAVLLTSGYTAQQFGALGVGSAELLRKPYTFSELSASVKRLIRR